MCQYIQGIDQMRPGLGAQVQKPFLQGATQFQILSQQQQLLAQVQAQGNVGGTPSYGDMRGLPRGNLNAKDGQTITNNGSVGSPMQTTTKVRCHPIICLESFIVFSLCQINLDICRKFFTCPLSLALDAFCDFGKKYNKYVTTDFFFRPVLIEIPKQN